MLQLEPFAAGDAGNGGDLVEHQVLEIRSRHEHVAAAEPGEIGKPGMRADGHPQVTGETHGPAEDGWIAGVESGRDAHRRHAAHDRGIVTQRVGAE